MNARRIAVAVVCLAGSTWSALAQPRVDPRNMYERVMAIVPMVGRGTFDDPKRPMYAPAPSETSPTTRTGILGFNYVASDDGRFALVEFVAADRTAFRNLLADPFIVKFLQGRDKRSDVEAAFKALKKDFDLDKFGKVVVP
jgi:hypothetical protein